MKTIHDIELIKRIWNNPMQTIGQRSNQLFLCYCFPFDWFREIENSDYVKNQLRNYPSIQYEIEKEFNCKLGTRRWTAPLRYISEDERELYEKAIDYIFKYEQNYPTPSELKINYRIKESGFPLDLKKLLGSIGYRPEMYLGSAQLSNLRAFIDGYLALKNQYEIVYSDFEIQLISFINDFVSKENKEYRTWDRNYRWTWDLAVYGANESSSVSRFLHDVEKYCKIKINPIVNDKEKEINWSMYRKLWKE